MILYHAPESLRREVKSFESINCISGQVIEVAGMALRVIEFQVECCTRLFEFSDCVSDPPNRIFLEPNYKMSKRNIDTIGTLRMDAGNRVGKMIYKESSNRRFAIKH